MTAPGAAPVARRGMDTTQAPKIAPRASTGQQSAPATVVCGECAEFEPGTPVWAGGIGKCSRTADGRPPIAGRHFGVCYPDAPRVCFDYRQAPP